MTAKKAYLKLIKYVAGGHVSKCYEYDTLFVFQIVPMALLMTKPKSPALDTLMSVDKTTGEINDFKPFYISVDEYKRGKEVPESEYKR